MDEVVSRGSSPRSDVEEHARLPEIRVVLLGDPQVGKTTFLRRYLRRGSQLSSLPCHDSTLLDSYTHIEEIDSQSYRVCFIDCCSAPSFREHRAAYLAYCDLVILMYSVHRLETLRHLRLWTAEVTAARASATSAKPSMASAPVRGVPIFVVGTHHGEADVACPFQAVSTTDAERVTAECLHSVGYFIDGEDATAALERGASVAKAAKMFRPREAVSKPPQSLFHNLLSKVFHNSGSQGTTKKRNSGSGVAVQNPLMHSKRCRSLQVSSLSEPQPSALQLQQPTGSAASQDAFTPVANIPAGASSRLPLYQLSNTNEEAVRTAMRISLALYLQLRRQEALEATASSLRTTCSNSSSATEMSPLCLQQNRALPTKGTALRTVSSKTSMKEPPTTPSTEPRTCSFSVNSYISHASERSSVFLLPPMPSVYTLGLSSTSKVTSTGNLSARQKEEVWDAAQTPRSSPAITSHSGVQTLDQEQTEGLSTFGDRDVAVPPELTGEAEMTKLVAEKAASSLRSSSTNASLKVSPGSFLISPEFKGIAVPQSDVCQTRRRSPSLVAPSSWIEGASSSELCNDIIAKEVTQNEGLASALPNPLCATVANMSQTVGGGGELFTATAAPFPAQLSQTLDVIEDGVTSFSGSAVARCVLSASGPIDAATLTYDETTDGFSAVPSELRSHPSMSKDAITMACGANGDHSNREKLRGVAEAKREEAEVLETGYASTSSTASSRHDVCVCDDGVDGSRDAGVSVSPTVSVSSVDAHRCDPIHITIAKGLLAESDRLQPLHTPRTSLSSIRATAMKEALSAGIATPLGSSEFVRATYTPKMHPPPGPAQRQRSSSRSTQKHSARGAYTEKASSGAAQWPARSNLASQTLNGTAHDPPRRRSTHGNNGDCAVL